MTTFIVSDVNCKIGFVVISLDVIYQRATMSMKIKLEVFCRLESLVTSWLFNVF